MNNQFLKYVKYICTLEYGNTEDPSALRAHTDRLDSVHTKRSTPIYMREFVGKAKRMHTHTEW